MINEDNLKPYMLVSSSNLEEFENDCNDLIFGYGYTPAGDLSTSSVTGKGDIITVYTQAFICTDFFGDDEDDDEECECSCCTCHKDDESEEPEEDKDTEKDSTLDKAAKQLLVEPANETKKTTKSDGKKKK